MQSLPNPFPQKGENQKTNHTFAGSKQWQRGQNKQQREKYRERSWEKVYQHRIEKVRKGEENENAEEEASLRIKDIRDIFRKSQREKRKEFSVLEGQIKQDKDEENECYRNPRKQEHENKTNLKGGKN